MFWIIIGLLLLAFLMSDSGKIVVGIGIISLGVFLISKITGFSILEQIPKWGLVVIIIVICGAVLGFVFQDW